MSIKINKRGLCDSRLIARISRNIRFKLDACIRLKNVFHFIAFHLLSAIFLRNFPHLQLV